MNLKISYIFAFVICVSISDEAHSQVLPEKGTRYWLLKDGMMQFKFTGVDSVKEKTISYNDSDYYMDNGYFPRKTEITTPRRWLDSTFAIIESRFHRFPTTLSEKEVESAQALLGIRTISKENFIKYLTDCAQLQESVSIPDADMTSMMYYFSQCRIFAFKLGYSPFFSDEDLKYIMLKFKDDTDVLRLEHSLGN
jgi:hypothetical protein